MKDGPERLGSLLHRLDIFDEEAARICGVSRMTIWRWRKGRSRVPRAALEALDDALVVMRAKRVNRKVGKTVISTVLGNRE